MFQRVYTNQPDHSFFLFGARGTGKSSWIEAQFGKSPAWIIDLLDPEAEDRFRQQPKLLEDEYLAFEKPPEWIVIDEVQRAPRLLNVVHRMIERYRVKFALTGSSARKLRRGASNLLAGRAFLSYLYPLTRAELGSTFDLNTVLSWGSLPNIFSLTDAERERYLRAYTLVYLNEEIRAEQVVRKLEPFREFLGVAAQHNGKILNYTGIAKDVGVDVKTVQSYFQILEDTWMGFHVPAYHASIRKAQRQHPKFYWFDIGVKRALEQTLDMQPRAGTSYFGECFEHLVILEIFRLNQYLERDYRLSYFMTQNSDAEIDLILNRGKQPPILVEIKSSLKVDMKEVGSLARLAKDFRPQKIFYLSLDPHAKRIGAIDCLHWEQGLKKLFDGP